MDVPDHEHGPQETPVEPAGLTRLNVPVPPGLAEVFGYRGSTRHVGFYWEPMGDESIYDDGRRSGTGEWYPFKLYREHRSVAPQLVPYNLGSSEQRADHWLIVDRQAERAFVASVNAAISFLRSQHPPPPQVTTAQLQAIREEMARRLAELPAIDMDQVQRAMMERREAVERLTAFLDGWRP